MTERLDRLVAAAAASVPDRAAVVDGHRVLTYAELEERVGRLAGLLAGHGVVRGDRVALYLDKSAESLVGLYAALRAGAAYVPLDPDAPPARLAAVARDCEPKVLLTGAEKAGRWDEVAGASPALAAVVVLNGDDDGELPEAAAGVPVLRAATTSAPAGPPPDGDPGDLAYLLYTSGSTGTPKGIALSHRNGFAFVDWAVAEFGVSGEDRLSSHAPLHFDLSTFDVFAAARAAATVVLVPPSASVFPVVLARFVAEQAISVWYSVPSVLTALTLRGGLQGGELPRLRTVLFAGEVFPTKYLRRLMELLPHAEFANLYGPTETNVCTYHRVPPLPPGRDEPIPIGRAIAGVDAFIVTDAGTLAAPGEPGELLIQGPTVMQGYWRDPERSAKALAPPPFPGAPSAPAYRTGDLVREREDGEILFLGRRDAQIKSRGYRIELGDIETALYAHPDVVECAVVPVPDDRVTNRIKAVVAARGPLRESALARFCAGRVPRYMVPDAFEFRDALPKTSTGKIDRQRLLQGRDP
ncbi:MAG TPA: amino acid adenylation domain-containing protein [Solirubrobacteraceae bacterium]|nr:amino acid adenylation domain-containing protein [Solirubrobacteraceae bacterium]